MKFEYRRQYPAMALTFYVHLFLTSYMKAGTLKSELHHSVHLQFSFQNIRDEPLRLSDTSVMSLRVNLFMNLLRRPKANFKASES